MFDRVSERPHKHPTEQNEPYFVILFFCNVLDIATPPIIPHLPTPLTCTGTDTEKKTPSNRRIKKKKEQNDVTDPVPVQSSILFFFSDRLLLSGYWVLSAATVI